MKKKEYKVYMKVTSYYVGTFEAEGPAEARKLAEEAEGSCFKKVGDAKWEPDAVTEA